MSNPMFRMKGPNMAVSTLFRALYVVASFMFPSLSNPMFHMKGPNIVVGTLSLALLLSLVFTEYLQLSLSNMALRKERLLSLSHSYSLSSTRSLLTASLSRTPTIYIYICIYRVLLSL